MMRRSPEIRQAYAETGAAIALGQKGEAGGLYCNKLALNNFNGSWRAVGNYSQTIMFWYSDQPAVRRGSGQKTGGGAGQGRGQGNRGRGFHIP